MSLGDEPAVGVGWGGVREAPWLSLQDPSVPDSCPLHQDVYQSLTLVRSFLAFSNLSISIFWALATKTGQAVTQQWIKQEDLTQAKEPRTAACRSPRGPVCSSSL